MRLRSVSAVLDSSHTIQRRPMKLAILIPAYNCGATIGDTLKSLQSISAGWEYVEKVVVCDDGSTDDTVAAIQSIAFDRCPLTLLRHSTNKGEPACYRTLVEALSEHTEWFLILHSDDLALDCFLERNIEVLKQCDSTVAAVSSNYYVFTESTECLAHSPAEDTIVFRGGAAAEIRHTATVGCWWHISGSLVNKRLWQEFGGTSPELNQVADWDLMLRWQRAGYRVGHYLIPTTKYRVRRAASVSARSYLEFRDVRERIRVIGGYPDVFTPDVSRKLAIRFGFASLRRVCRLVLAGKFRPAVRGISTGYTCFSLMVRSAM